MNRQLTTTILRRLGGCSLALAMFAGVAHLAQAQPKLSKGELDNLVARIALYPDPLLAQVLSASTYSDQIPEAAKWSDEHHYLTGDALAAAISSDHLPWDGSVQALLPFPNVLETMSSDMAWTTQLGNAVLAQRPEVMDAVQRERKKAYDFGYLRTNAQIVVTPGPYITIAPFNPGFIVVPAYDPAVVFVAPRPGFVVGGAISFGWGISIGAAFAPWGWGGISFGWATHGWVIGGHPWERTWANRMTYAHPFGLPHYGAGRRVETHELIQRSAREREAGRMGHAFQEEHRGRR